MRFWTFCPPCPPFYKIGLWSNVAFWQIPIPLLKWVTSFIDSPLVHSSTFFVLYSLSVSSVYIYIFFWLTHKWIKVVQSCCFFLSFQQYGKRKGLLSINIANFSRKTLEEKTNKPSTKECIACDIWKITFIPQNILFPCLCNWNIYRLPTLIVLHSLHHFTNSVTETSKGSEVSTSFHGFNLRMY